MHDHDRALHHDDHAAGSTTAAPGKRTLTSAIQRKATGTDPPPAAADAAPRPPVDASAPFWFADGPRTAEPASTIWRKATAEVRDASPELQFTAATRGSAGEIPFRAEMEHSFGEDFGGVRAFFGRAAELDGLGAHAATRDEHVAFANAAPDRELVAHELAHVVQARRGGRGTGAVSSPHDGAEREADAAAAKVARGEPVAIGGGAPATIARKGPCHVVTSSESLAMYGLAPGQEVFIEDDLAPEGLARRANEGGSVLARFRGEAGWTRQQVPARLLAIDTYRISPKVNPDDNGGHPMSKFVLQPHAIGATDEHLVVKIDSVAVNQWDRASWQIRLQAPSGHILNLAPDPSWWNNPGWDAEEMQATSFGSYRFREGFKGLKPHGDGQRGTDRTIIAKLPLKTIQAFFKRHGGMTDISKIVVGMTVRYSEGLCPVTADVAEFVDAFGFEGQYHGEGIVRENGDGTVDLSAVAGALKLPPGERATDAEVWNQPLPPNPRPNLERLVTPEYVHEHPLMEPLVPKSRDGKEAPPQKLQTRIENEATLHLTNLAKLDDLILMLDYLCTHPKDLQKMMCPGGTVLDLFKWSLSREGAPLVFTDIYLDDPMFTALRSGVGIRKRSTTKATKLNVKTGEGYNVGHLVDKHGPGQYDQHDEKSDIYRRHEIGYDLDEEAQPEDIGAFLQSGVDKSDPWNKGGEEANRATRTAGNGTIDFAQLAAKMVLKGHRSKFKLSAVDSEGGTINIELSCDHTVGRTFHNYQETEQLDEQPDPFKTFEPTYHHLYNLEMELEHLGAGGAQTSTPTPSRGSEPSSSSQVESEPQLPLAPLPKEPPVGHPGRMYLLKDTDAPQLNTPSFQVFYHAQRRFVEMAREEGLGHGELGKDRQKLDKIFEALAPSMDTGRPFTPMHARVQTDGPWQRAKGLRTPVVEDVGGCCYEKIGPHRVITVVDRLVQDLPVRLLAGAQTRSLDGRTEYWFPSGAGPSQLWQQVQKLHR